MRTVSIARVHDKQLIVLTFVRVMTRIFTAALLLFWLLLVVVIPFFVVLVFIVAFVLLLLLMLLGCFLFCLRCLLC